MTNFKYPYFKLSIELVSINPWARRIFNCYVIFITNITQSNPCPLV